MRIRCSTYIMGCVCLRICIRHQDNIQSDLKIWVTGPKRLGINQRGRGQSRPLDSARPLEDAAVLLSVPHLTFSSSPSLLDYLPAGQRVGHSGAVPAGVGHQEAREEEGFGPRGGGDRRDRVRHHRGADDGPAGLAFPL